MINIKIYITVKIHCLEKEKLPSCYRGTTFFVKMSDVTQHANC
jgi:hypothetical protein